MFPPALGGLGTALMSQPERPVFKHSLCKGEILKDSILAFGHKEGMTSFCFLRVKISMESVVWENE